MSAFLNLILKIGGVGRPQLERGLSSIQKAIRATSPLVSGIFSSAMYGQSVSRKLDLRAF